MCSNVLASDSAVLMLIDHEMSDLVAALEQERAARLRPEKEMVETLKDHREHSAMSNEFFERLGLQGVNPDGLLDSQGAEQIRLGSEVGETGKESFPAAYSSHGDHDGIEHLLEVVFFEEHDESDSVGLVPPHESSPKTPEESFSVKSANPMAVIEGTAGSSKEGEKTQKPAEEVTNACDVREKELSRASTLKTHQGIHSGEKAVACDVCERKFRYPSELRQHQRTHTGDKPFPCDVCDKKFFTRSYLKDHQRIHTGEKPFTCNVCDRSFAYSGHFAVHRRMHTGEKPFSCDFCEKKFLTRSHLKDHQRTHSGEKPFTCNVCDKSFARSGQFTIHGRIHTGEKPYSCDICAKKFSAQGKLTVHRRTHTNEKPIASDVSRASAKF